MFCAVTVYSDGLSSQAQEELAQEAADDDLTAAVDKSQAYKKLSQTLNALLSRLENLCLLSCIDSRHKFS